MADEIKEILGKVVIPYRWSYGKALTGFFHETSVNKRIMGARCHSCDSVIIPPVGLCGGCFVATDPAWVEVSDHGELVTYTEVQLPFPGQPTEPPYIYGLIKFDGADTVYPHMIEGIALKDMEPGMRVKAVWNSEREGNLFDILYFEPE